jgi:hypothetical protein
MNWKLSSIALVTLLGFATTACSGQAPETDESTSDALVAGYVYDGQAYEISYNRYPGRTQGSVCVYPDTLNNSPAPALAAYFHGSVASLAYAGPHCDAFVVTY